MKKFLRVLMSLPLIVSAQINPSAADFLDTNNVKAPVLCNADFGRDLNGSQYEVPKGSGKHPLYCGSLWAEGYHSGTLHAAANTYRQNGIDFWPGPLDTTNASISITTSNQWNKLWKISRGEIDQFLQQWNLGNVQNGNYVPPASITTWPAHGAGNQAKYLAPFVDVNGNGIYDPVNEGDYPLIKGDQMIWWVINDALTTHGETGALPMGIEIQCSAYAYNRPCVPQSQQIINNATFYDYRIINRSANTYDSTRIGLFVDADLGNAQDDYAGCDVMRKLAFTYNGTNTDAVYGTNPPVLSVLQLKGPPADLGDGMDNDRDGCLDCSFYTNPSTCSADSSVNIPDNLKPETIAMSSFMYFDNNVPYSVGSSACLPMLNHHWCNGAYLTYGGDGTNAANVNCTFAFPGASDQKGWGLGYQPTISPIPMPAWSEHLLNRTPGDRRMEIGLGMFTLMPLEAVEAEFAILYNHDSNLSNNIAQIQAAQTDADTLLRLVKCSGIAQCSGGIGVKENHEEERLLLYPNPAHDVIRILGVANVKVIRVLNAMGAEVKVDIVNGAEIDISKLKPGMYFLQLSSELHSVTMRFVKE